MTKPLVFNYGHYEKLRDYANDLLLDNEKLMADNRKLRQEVTELKQLNDGYVKIIAKNQETNNKLMASVKDKQIVVKPLYMLNKEDYEKWATEVKQNSSCIITLPYDAEVVNGRPHGEWQVCEDEDGIYGNCSVCGCDADFSHYGKAFDFCPNCGADMREMK